MMCLTSTLIWWLTIFFMISLRTDCYPRMYPRTFQQGGWSSANQQPLNSPFQSAIPQSLVKISDPVPQQRQKKVSVLCHDDAIEVVMNADLFAAGFPVYAEELWLGPGSSSLCGAVRTGELVLTIIAYYKDCGTKLSVTDDSLVYSNVLVYSPQPSPDGVLRQEGEVIPVQCQFQRRYNVDSAAVAPAWVPFAATVSSTDYLDFALRLMSVDWQYERGSNVYFLGDAIRLQASVTLANHLPLLLFIDWCVATPTFNFDANDIKYSFVDNRGCLSDSRSSYSRSKFLQRSEGNKLNLMLDAFKFHKLTSNSVYITCSLKAIPAAYSASAENRACSFIDGRWQSVDGIDEVCNSCEPPKQGAAEPEQIRITQAPPVMQPKALRKSGPADFSEVIPGQSLGPFRALIQSRQYALGGPSKRGTGVNEDWKLATLGPLLLIPKEGTTTQSVAHPRSGPAEGFSASVTDEPEFLFNLTKMSPVSDEPAFKIAPEIRSFHPLEDGLFLNASDLFGSEEGSGFE